jgi:hypothetical protein
MSLPDAAELKKLAKQLQSAPNQSEILDILKILKNDYQVSESLLRESKIGLAVGKLRTHNMKDVSDLAKEIVKKMETCCREGEASSRWGGKASSEWQNHGVRQKIGLGESRHPFYAHWSELCSLSQGRWRQRYYRRPYKRQVHGIDL